MNSVHAQFQQIGKGLVVRLKTTKLSEQAIVQELKAELQSNIEEVDVSQVILDFQEVRYVGSIAFLAFLSLRRIPKINRIVVCQLDPNVREIFAICRLIPVGEHLSAPFEVADSVEEALG